MHVMTSGKPLPFGETVRGFVVPCAGYLGTPGILFEEIVNPPCAYFEGAFEPSFFSRTFGRSPSTLPTF